MSSRLRHEKSATACRQKPRNDTASDGNPRGPVSAVVREVVRVEEVAAEVVEEIPPQPAPEVPAQLVNHAEVPSLMSSTSSAGLESIPPASGPAPAPQGELSALVTFLAQTARGASLLPVRQEEVPSLGFLPDTRLDSTPSDSYAAVPTPQQQTQPYHWGSGGNDLLVLNNGGIESWADLTEKRVDCRSCFQRMELCFCGPPAFAIALHELGF